VLGFELDTVCFTYPLVVIAHGEGGRLKVQLNGPFGYQDADGNGTHLNAEKDRWEAWVPLLSLRHDKLVRADVSTGSVLTIEFDSERLITAAPSDGYEGWEVVGPGFYVVGATDGPAIWTGDAWS
jgi:hypothetical protein